MASANAISTALRSPHQGWIWVKVFMSLSTVDDDGRTYVETEKIPVHVLEKLLDSIIYDVASECHRMARLGVDWNVEVEDEELRLCAEAVARMSDPLGSGEVNGVDLFGQTHPAVANEIFECMNCGQSIMAGRFAPHLEKCMGKGRRAQQKARRSSRIAQKKHSCTTRKSTSAAAATASSSMDGGAGTIPAAGLERDMESSNDSRLN